jgi:hypothetical protein
MTEPTTINIVLGQIALIAVMATVALGWVVVRGLLHYRRRK